MAKHMRVRKDVYTDLRRSGLTWDQWVEGVAAQRTRSHSGHMSHTLLCSPADPRQRLGSLGAGAGVLALIQLSSSVHECITAAFHGSRSNTPNNAVQPAPLQSISGHRRQRTPRRHHESDRRRAHSLPSLQITPAVAHAGVLRLLRLLRGRRAMDGLGARVSELQYASRSPSQLSSVHTCTARGLQRHTGITIFIDTGSRLDGYSVVKW